MDYSSSIFKTAVAASTEKHAGTVAHTELLLSPWRLSSTLLLQLSRRRRISARAFLNDVLPSLDISA